MNYVYILLTIILTVYGQLIIKWQVSNYGYFPNDIIDKLNFISHLLLNPWVISALLSAFLASISWMVAMTKFDLSHAYPFTSLSFVMVFFFSMIFFHEVVSPIKITGMSLVIIGIIIGSQG